MAKLAGPNHGGIIGWIQRNRGIILPLAVISLILVIVVPLAPWQFTSTLPGPSSPHHSFALPSLTKPKPQLTKTFSIHPQILAKTPKFLLRCALKRIVRLPTSVTSTRIALAS